MYILAIDTSFSALSLAIAKDDQIIANCGLDSGLQHSKVLLNLTDSLLKAADLSLANIDMLAISIGPGSFTGLRIGLATVKAWALALAKPLIAISSLQGLAYTAMEQGFLICPILDARRNQVYATLFDEKKRLLDDQLLKIDDLLLKLKVYQRPIIFCGDALSTYRQQIKDALAENAYFALPERQKFIAAALTQIAAQMYEQGQICDPISLEPNYLRLAEAERKKLGIEDD